MSWRGFQSLTEFGGICTTHQFVLPITFKLDIKSSMLRCCRVEFRIWWIVFRMLGPVLIFWLQSTHSPALIQLYSDLLCSGSVLKSALNLTPNYGKVPRILSSTCKSPEVPDRYILQLRLSSDLIKVYSAGAAFVNGDRHSAANLHPASGKPLHFHPDFFANSILNKSVENNHILDKLW